MEAHRWLWWGNWEIKLIITEYYKGMKFYRKGDQNCATKLLVTQTRVVFQVFNTQPLEVEIIELNLWWKDGKILHKVCWYNTIEINKYHQFRIQDVYIIWSDTLWHANYEVEGTNLPYFCTGKWIKHMLDKSMTDTRDWFDIP